MSSVGRSLSGVARTLERIPDEAVREAAEKIKTYADSKGGRFAGRPVTVKVVPPRRSGTTTVAKITGGRSAGAWSIKSYGRGSVRPRRKKVLKSADGRFFMSAGPAVGDGRWDRVVAYAEDVAPDVVARVVFGRVSRGS